MTYVFNEKQIGSVVIDRQIIAQYGNTDMFNMVNEFGPGDFSEEDWSFMAETVLNLPLREDEKK